MSIKTFVAEAVTATPAASTITLTLFGIPLSGWATMLSIVVLFTQLFFLLRKNLKGRKDGTTD